MNTLEVVQEKVSKLIPGASISLDSPTTPTGSSWLDIKSNNQVLTIEYKSSLGFGLYSFTNSSYGEGPDEIYRNVNSLLKRIEMLFIEHKINIKLKELRELLGKTQEQHSLLSGQKQPSISKLESRTDMQLSTIQKFVSSLGGSLEIRAHFEEFDVPITLPSLKNTSS